jgi:drug/metabolite transporter (DMT)-like permease
MTFLLSVLAALVLGLGVALQQQAAMRVPAEYAGKPGLLVRLVRNPLWWLGFAGDIGGFALQTAALRRGSLVVVQPVLTTSLVFSLGLTAAASHQPITRIEWGAIGMVLAGLSLFLIVAAPPEQTSAHAGMGSWLLCGTLVGAMSAIALVIGLRSGGVSRSAMMAVAAGLADALLAVFVKAFATSFNRGIPGIFETWMPYAVIAAGIATVLLIQSAYQSGHPTIALPVITVLNPLAASLIGITLFGETVRLTAASGPLVVLAAAVMALGLIVLGRQDGATRTVRVNDNPRSRSDRPVNI